VSFAGLYAESIANGHPDLAPGAALEADYLMRLAVPSWAEHMAAWAAGGKAVRAAYDIKRDIRYGQSAAERLDIIMPLDPVENMPVLVLIHGGYWRALDKDSILFAAGPPARSGIITVNIEYALCPGVSLTALTAQCHRALRWVRGNIGAYGGDAQNIHCAGHSAGAHLAAMLALSPEFSDFIQTICAVSGVFDLAPVACASMQADLRLTEDEVLALSPLRLPPPRRGHWIFAAGTAETAAFIWQTERYAAHCTAGGATAQVIRLHGANHYTAISMLDEDGCALQEAWLRHIKESRE
jgi:arylformamidase